MQDQSVSVVITTYNRDNFLAEALISLANQTIPLHDVVVVDDGGTGSARHVVEGFGPPFRYFWQPNAGMQSARNRGIQESTGDWIAYLDDDDLWEASRHELLLKVISTGQVDIVFSDFRKFGANWLSETGVFEEIARLSPWFFDDLRKPDDKNFSVVGSLPTTRLFPVNPFWPSAMAIRRDLQERIGTWDVALSGVKSEDWDFVFRAIKVGQLGIIWEPTVRYRSHDGNDSADELARALGRVHVWEHLLKRADIDEGERIALSTAISDALKSALWAAFDRREFRVTKEIAGRMGWRKLTFKELGKTLVAKLYYRNSSHPK